MEWVSIDATHVRAHQSSAGSAGDDYQYIAKSVGGNSSKIHLAVDAHGNPIEFIVSDGVTHDIKIAPMLLQLLDLQDTEFLNADKGYDSEEFRSLAYSQGVRANIPRKKNAKSNNSHMDWLIYQELLSNLVYGIQAAFSVDCSSSCLPSLKMTLLTTKVNKLNP